MNDKVKILQIGNYPPPMCGWGIQTKLVTEELRRRGHICQVLKINENRRLKDSAYIDVQGGWDYLRKVCLHAFRGYRLNVHVNGMSKKGYVLALIAVLAGRMVNRPALLTFHGGLSQYYFPRQDSSVSYHAFRILFRLAGGIACDSAEIKQAIEAYGIQPDKIAAIATFSSQYLNFTPAPLSQEVERFLAKHNPVFFSYVSFRPEYRLEVVRECMALYQKRYPDAGFIWLGFPATEFLEAQQFVEPWTTEEKKSLLLLGNLTHDEFLTLMTRCFACLRTPACDGVAASVLEALTLGVPVVASQNGRRPAGVITYEDTSASDMCAKLMYVTENYAQVKANLGSHTTDDNVSRMADWLAGETTVGLRSEWMHASHKSVQSRWSRLVAMGAQELLERGRQELGKRLDEIRYRLGDKFAIAQLKVKPETSPKFFFGNDEVSSLVGLLLERFPKETAEIVERAERICRHRFDLMGYEDLDYGAEIDWHSDQVHGKRAPRKLWFKIPYLDFAEVGDAKVTWELNRHQHFVNLAKAYRLTGDERFAAEIFGQWRHWHAENPYPIGINWASSLEVAFRSLSWIWTYFLLGDCSAAPAGFRSEWLRALGVNGRHIERYLSTYFSPNTHLLGEAVALFFIGTLCPELPPAERWKRRGWEIVLRESVRQVQADGLHFEQSIYYHVYALDFFLHASALALMNGISIPAEFERTLEKMLNVLYVLCQAGAPPRLGDDDGGRVFDPRRNRAEHMLDPLATGAVLFGRGDFKSVAGGLREETVWLLGEQGIAEFDRLPANDPVQDSIALRAAGLYVATSDEPKQQLVIDAGSQGAMMAGHGHADALAVCLNSQGRALLIDPGTFEYVGEDSSRHQFRGTRAHNTLLVDGLDQAEPAGPFSWTKLPVVKTEKWISGKSFDLFVGSHDGYCRLESPVVHRRWIFSLKKDFWLVRDQALGSGEHQLDLFWHLNPGWSAHKEDRHTFFDTRSVNAGLRVLAAEGHGWSRDLRPGWWSPVYGRKEPAHVLYFGIKAALPAEFVTLLMLTMDAQPGAGSLTQIRQSSESKSVRGYRYRTSEEEHCFFFAGNEPWTLGPWASDAEFLYWSGSLDQSVRRLICCDATYVEASGQKIVSSPRPISRCEIIVSGEQVEVFSSENDAIVKKEALPASSELEPALIDTPPGSKRTRS